MKKPHNCKCETCGKTFRRKPSHIRPGLLFCNLKCRMSFDRLEMEFWKRVLVGDGCWNWVGSLTFNKLYGRLKYKRRIYPAHRLAWKIWNGNSHRNLCVCHKCDNGLCVNPNHLFLGTVTDNNSDRHSKGRDASGDRHGSRLKPWTRPVGSGVGTSKLTENQVLDIRSRYVAKKLGFHRLAKAYSVSKSTVMAIIKRETWTHV